MSEERKYLQKNLLQESTPGFVIRETVQADKPVKVLLPFQMSLKPCVTRFNPTALNMSHFLIKVPRCHQAFQSIIFLHGTQAVYNDNTVDLPSVFVFETLCFHAEVNKSNFPF